MTDDERPGGDNDDVFAELETGSGPPTDDVFEEVGSDAPVSDVDLAALLDEGPVADAGEGTETAVDAMPEDVEPASEGCIVPKDRYCEGCEYLSDPPMVSCLHDGTSINELVDTDHVRVSDCPVVAERGRIAPDSNR